MSNDLIIANLQVLLKTAQTSRDSKDRFRAAAYRKAISAIQNAGYQITSGKEAQKLEGVGKGIADKIQEIIETGSLHQVQDLGKEKLEKTQGIALFSKIWGVGPKKAGELWDKGARNISDIKRKYTHLLTDNQKIGLKYFDDLQKRATRDKVSELERKIVGVIRRIEKKTGWRVKYRVCGSYRRQLPTSGDMDLLLYEENMEPILPKLVGSLSEIGVLTDNLGLGPTKYMGIAKLSSGMAFRVDMEVIKEHEWPFALLYFTGSGRFNEKQRLVAKKMGYSLSEHGLRDVETGEYVSGITSERDIFEFLDMDYLPPWERDL